MNEVKTFEHPMFGELPVIIVGGKEHFGATDVASSLEYKQPHTAVTNHCDLDGVITYNVIDNLGRNQQKKFITLGNVSRLIVGASKQSKNLEIQQKAKVYEKWIFDEVIPSVHKHGAYMTPQTIDSIISDPDFGIQLLTTLKVEKEKRVKAEQASQQANQVIEQQKPKVLFADAIQASYTSILIGEFAKILKQNGVEIGQKRLFEWLRENGYLIKRRGSDFNSPTQRAMELKLFEIKETPIHHNSGEISINRTTKMTGKGQAYFVDKFLGNKKIML